jgi:prepilin signal peptidase PulO-like enzyme (type II secretory pathway)
MGYGDMLLMGCVGAFCGWQGTLASISGGAVLALPVILLISLLQNFSPVKDEEELPDEPAPPPLGRRQFKFDYLLVLATAAGGFAWLWHERGTYVVWPGMVCLGLIFAGAALQRRRLVVDEGWLLLGVLAGMIFSCILSSMHGIAPSGSWLADALRGQILSFIDAIVGAGLALWVFEFANLSRFYLLPPSLFPAPDESSTDQIWCDGYLLLFGVIGAFCGWRTAVIALTIFAALAVVKTVWYLIGTREAKMKNGLPTGASTELVEDISLFTPEAVNSSTWTLNKPIPFGPWLALGGFIYYAFAHNIVNNYFDYLQKLVFEIPGPA